MIIQEYEKIDTSAQLSRIRLQNTTEHQRRLNEIYDKIPEIKNLDNQVSSIALEEVKKRLRQDKANYSDSYESSILEISNKKAELLETNGYPKDYLDPIYNCPICQDWGEHNGKICECVKKIRIKELYNRSNLSNILSKENFDSYTLDYYSNEAYEDNKLTPYENAEKQYNVAQNFVKNFDTKHDNLLIYGGTGLGKTFLSNCIAKELLDSGHSVLYLSSNELFRDILVNYTTFNDLYDQKVLEEIYEYIFSSDLLIIDDLGSEVISAFVVSHLFEIINRRMLLDHSTLITTNFDLDTIQDRYSDRVSSRIAEKYILCPLYGDDIRYRRKK